MKKFIIAAAVVFGTLTFTACTKENLAPKANTLATEDGNKDQLGQGDRTTPTTPAGEGDENKDQLGQGDRNPANLATADGDPNKDQLGQGDRTGGSSEGEGDGNKDQLGQGDRQP